MLNPSYFKFRDRFDFHPHPYEIGNPLIFNDKLENNFFFKKLLRLPENEYKSFFYFHQNYYLEKYPQQEKQFLEHLLELVQHRIEASKLEGFYRNAEKVLDNLARLKAFKYVLIELDEWNIHKSLEMLLVERDIELATCRQEISELKHNAKLSSVYDADSKIRLNKGTLPTFIDLIQQIQKLTLPDGRKFTMYQSQSPWYKMIAKYFQHGENEISLDTLRNYLQAPKDTKSIKGTEVKAEDKLFTIKPKTPKKP